MAFKCLNGARHWSKSLLRKVARSRMRHERIIEQDELKSYKERIAEFKAEEEKHVIRNNIGYPLKELKYSDNKEWFNIRGKNKEAAEKKTLLIDLDEVQEKSLQETGAKVSKAICEHYGIYRDLFDYSYFYSKIFMNIEYDVDDENVLPVYSGNIIQPTDTKTAPSIYYSAEDSKYYTLVMSSPDGNLQHNDQEFLHWIVGNIPGNQIEKGETICSYLPPFPPKGPGLMRYVFILYEQNQQMDFEEIKIPDNSVSLSKRNFQTVKFYGERQEMMTPVSVSFFQSEYDESVQRFYWDVLGIKEPLFEYFPPPNYHPKQQKHPSKQAFDLYLDRYRDIYDIQEEVLRERLKNNDPLTPQKEYKYPLATINHYKRSWQRTKDRNKILKKHQWQDL